MIPWRVFLTIWGTYTFLFYFVFGLFVWFGFSFQNPPPFLFTIARVYIFPASIVDKVFSFITGRELYYFVSIVLGGLLVSSLTCLIIYGVKLLIKKLSMSGT